MTPDEAGASVIDRAAWADDPQAEIWRGEFEGGQHGAGLSIVFVATDEIGAGPRLHRHPYPETFVIRAGRALFTIGGETIEARAGQILVAPAGVAHKFANLGPGRLESMDIHLAGAFATEWLE